MSKMGFREHGHVVPTQRAWRRWASAAAWPALGVMALLSVLALGAWIDEPAPDTGAEMQASADFEAGRLAEREAAARLVLRAYQQGWADAVAELQRQPLQRQRGTLQAEARP